MAVPVPAVMEAVLREADAAIARLDEITFSGTMRRVAPEASAIPENERRGAFAEWAAWNFMRPHGVGATERKPWGIYWSPLAGFTTTDGKTVHSPDVAEMDEEIISHWIERAFKASHPAINARSA